MQKCKGVSAEHQAGLRYAERRSISMMGHQNTKKCCYFIVSQRVIFLTKENPLLFSAKIPAIL